MSIYTRIKNLLLEVSGRDNPDVVGRIGLKHALKVNKNPGNKTELKLSKKYNQKKRNLVGELPEPSYKPSRLPNSGKSASFKAKI